MPEPVLQARRELAPQRAGPFLWYMQIPTVTRTWFTFSSVLAVLTLCGAIDPFRLFVSWSAISEKHEYWRLVTCFLYVGPLSLDFLFLLNMSRMLEDSSYYAEPWKYMRLLTFSAILLLIISKYMHLSFLSGSLSFEILYIWTRRNQDAQLHVWFFPVNAALVPWIILAVNYFIGLGTLGLREDLAGILVGHICWYLEDILPHLYHKYCQQRLHARLAAMAEVNKNGLKNEKDADVGITINSTQNNLSESEQENTSKN